MAKAPKTKAPIEEAEGNTETSGSAAAPVSDAPSSGAATGTNSTDEPPESEGQGGAGNAAGSAESEFRAKFPRFSAELDAWKAEHGDELPAGLRIRSKVEGFRRGGIAHSKAEVDHPIEAFKSPEQLEAIFAEPKLKVELI
ncbi:hypothetical protein [Mesorhizobium sp.]|uniref:HI1506-related protein n=1 Tax=Mesorhizobium sp. TaxID=1871066 RepID=UPI000FE4A809|nr:hypothetical protein [Mesorhizobium sp.]RWB50843.1 MAG: hypothetical protein EOQ47_31830 [Mesorhizobium sp.]